MLSASDVIQYYCTLECFFFFSSRRRHTRLVSDWSSDVCSSDLEGFWGLTRNPLLPCSIISAIPPRLEAMTTHPIDMASRQTLAQFSQREGNTQKQEFESRLGRAS